MNTASSPHQEVIINRDTTEVDLTCSDGRLRPAIGTHNIQTMRANREKPHEADGYGWTYFHQPYLAYWNKTFYLEYLSSPVAEHEDMGHTLMQTSKDGVTWRKSQVIFPVYEVEPGKFSIMHQRMGFYVTNENRLLVLAFYGPYCEYPWPPKWDGPNNGTGIGRVVREVYRDSSLGPIYFIRYNRHAGWDENNTQYPFYQTSPDQGFISACDELLADRLATQQWWEEDRAEDGFFTITGQKAFSCYHRQDGQTVGLWKFANASLSGDDGQSWLPISRLPSFKTGGQKMWGQSTADGRYAVVYTPHPSKRWPLAVVTGEDGIQFDNLLAVHGEVSPMRYSGFCKDWGPQYVRGIAEGNGQPDEHSLWLTYSMNKEDIFVSRTPLPIRHRVEEPVHETFEEMPLGKWVRDWNVYTGQWTPVQVIMEPGTANRCLELRDCDPYDYASAVRVFPESKKARLQFRVKAGQTEWGWLEIDVVNARGQRPVQLILDNRGWLQTFLKQERQAVARYNTGEWLTMTIEIDCSKRVYSLEKDGKVLASGEPLLDEVDSVERIIFRTGQYRPAPQAQPTYLAAAPDLPNGGIPVKEAVYWLDDVQLSPQE